VVWGWFLGWALLLQNAVNVFGVNDGSLVLLLVEDGKFEEFGLVELRGNSATTIQMNVRLLTTLPATMAAVTGIRALKEKGLTYRSLQEHFRA